MTRRCLTPLSGSRTRGAGIVALCAVLAGPAAAAKAPGRMLVTATEFRFALSRTTLPAGRELIQLSDRGEDAHDLVVRRLDAHGREVGPERKLAPVAAGALGTLSVTLRPGRYVLYCSLPGHRSMGMQAHLTVRA